MECEEVEVNSERWFDLTPLLNEEFRGIEGFENYYQVSNYGRVIGIRNKILSAYDNGHGYVGVNLCVKSKLYHKYLHRLVAEAFIPNPNNYPEINHISENTYDNFVSNLEWCSSKYNANYGNRNLKMKISKIKLYGKKVNQYDLNDNFICCMEMSDAVKLDRVYYASLRKCCLGIYKTCGGYIWRYASE